VARSCAKTVMAALALAGITGMYLRQLPQGRPPRPGSAPRFAAGYLALFSVEVIAATVLPNLVDTEPGFVNDVVVAAAGGHRPGASAACRPCSTSPAPGTSSRPDLRHRLFRTRVLARWAAALLAVSTAGTAALAVLPDSFNRPFAVPRGIALIALGVSLWPQPPGRTPPRSLAAPVCDRGHRPGRAARRPMTTRRATWAVPSALLALGTIR
jgi:hypothetical protein